MLAVFILSVIYRVLHYFNEKTVVKLVSSTLKGGKIIVIKLNWVFSFINILFY